MLVAPRTFKYEIMWDRHPDLKNFLAQEWSKSSAGGSVQEISTKLQTLAEGLWGWDKHTFGHVRSEIRKLQRELEILKNVPGRDGPSHRELKINERLVELYLREEILMRQRSRVDWLTDGDRNTRFFQLRASLRRRKNHIKSLMKDNGQLTRW